MSKWFLNHLHPAPSSLEVTKNPGLPGTVPVYSCCPRGFMKNTPFHSQKYHPGFVGEVHSHSAHALNPPRYLLLLECTVLIHDSISLPVLFLLPRMPFLTLVSWKNYVQFSVLCSSSLSLEHVLILLATGKELDPFLCSSHPMLTAILLSWVLGSLLSQPVNP